MAGIGRLRGPLEKRQLRAAFVKIAVLEEEPGQGQRRQRLLLGEEVLDVAAAEAGQHRGAVARLDGDGDRADERARGVAEEDEVRRVDGERARAGAARGVEREPARRASEEG